MKSMVSQESRIPFSVAQRCKFQQGVVFFMHYFASMFQLYHTVIAHVRMLSISARWNCAAPPRDEENFFGCHEKKSQFVCYYKSVFFKKFDFWSFYLWFCFVWSGWRWFLEKSWKKSIFTEITPPVNIFCHSIMDKMTGKDGDFSSQILLQVACYQDFMSCGFLKCVCSWVCFCM